MKPFITVIVPTFVEGNTLRVSIESLLSQSFSNFEAIFVDVGGDDTTKSVLNSYVDPRFRVIHQQNEGLSAARNRALKFIRGDYVCFLDGDDMRPAWSFEKLASRALETRADCVFSRGMHVENDHAPKEFFDDSVFDEILKECNPPAEIHHAVDLTPRAKGLMYFLEPTSANKFISAELINRANLNFPTGLLFEDNFFHHRLLQTADSYSFCDTPCFTALRRYGKPHITDLRDRTRFDSIRISKLCMESFQNSDDKYSLSTQAGFVLSVLRHLTWSLFNTSSHLREEYLLEIMSIFRQLQSLGLLAPLCDRSIIESFGKFQSWTSDILRILDTYNRTLGVLDSWTVLDTDYWISEMKGVFAEQHPQSLLRNYQGRSARVLRELKAMEVDRFFVFGMGDVASCFMAEMFKYGDTFSCAFVTASHVDGESTVFYGTPVISLEEAIKSDITCAVICVLSDQVAVNSLIESKSLFHGKNLTILNL